MSEVPPLERLDYVKVLNEAKAIVRASVLWKRFIDGTPLENDIAVWMADFAFQVAEGEARRLEQHYDQSPSDHAREVSPLEIGAPSQAEDATKTQTEVGEARRRVPPPLSDQDLLMLGVIGRGHADMGNEEEIAAMRKYLAAPLVRSSAPPPHENDEEKDLSRLQSGATIRDDRIHAESSDGDK